MGLAIYSFLASQSAFAQTIVSNFPPAFATYTDFDEDPTNGLGSWIWTSQTYDMQDCHLWREFEIPDSATVTHAHLLMTADNEYLLFLDGRELGQGAEWHELYAYNLTYLLSPGKHVLAVKAYNASKFAGMILGLRIDLADGRRMEIKSDNTWKIVPNSETKWETRTEPQKSWADATVIGPVGCSPWWTRPDKVNPMMTIQPIKLFFWQTAWFQISSLSICALAILISLRLVGQLANHRRERWLLQKERARIARDIHDDLGSRMTQLVLLGEVAQSELPSESAARMHLAGICQEAREVLFTMDEILWGLNPKRDTVRDFASYICGYAQDFLKTTQIQCLLDVAPEISSVVLDLPFRRAFLMAVKETLNNTVKHSEADEVVVRVSCQKQKLVVIVSDNGKGFDQSKGKPGRNGLSNINERLHEIGGRCIITSKPGGGCRTELCVSLNQPSNWRSWKWALKPRRNSSPVNGSSPLDPRFN